MNDCRSKCETRGPEAGGKDRGYLRWGQRDKWDEEK